MPRGQAEAQVVNMEQAKKLDASARVFGAAGWRAPVEVSEFTQIGDGKLKEDRQEFVAIDRFTGGAAHQKKFRADYVLHPMFKGHLDVDLAALGRVEAGGWALALLAFVLRDLREGDISFGFGASKGYGSCRATIASVSCPTGFDGASAEQVEALLKDGASAPETLGWFEKLQTEVKKNATA